MLFNKDKTRLICYPENKYGEEYTVPNSVKRIDSFRECSYLKELNISENVEKIKDIYMGSIEQINVSSNNSHYSSDDGVLFDKEQKTLINYPKNKKASSYKIPNSVTDILTDFNSNENLRTLIIPNIISDRNGFYFSFSSLYDIYYMGSEEEWDNLNVRIYNSNVAFRENFKNTAIHYNYVDEDEHSFDEWTVIREGDCKKMRDGIEKRTCLKDGYSEYRMFAYSHDFGNNDKYCKMCGEENPDYVAPTPGGNTGGSTGGGGVTPAPTPDDTTKKAEEQKPDTKPTQPTTSTNTTDKLLTVTLNKIQAKKKALVVYWNKIADVSGYQIQVATDKKFKKNKNTVTVAKQNASKKTVKKLKANKKYYVRVRTYKVVNGKKSYGKWSKVKTVKTK